MPVTNDTYVTVQPDGSVLFNFAGHVQATGLDLPSLPANPNDNYIRWQPVPGGTGKVAHISAGGAGGAGQSAFLDIEANPLRDAGPSNLQVQSWGGPFTDVIMDMVANSGVATRINLEARDGSKNTVKTLLGAGETSDYVMSTAGAGSAMKIALNLVNVTITNGTDAQGPTWTHGITFNTLSGVASPSQAFYFCQAINSPDGRDDWTANVQTGPTATAMTPTVRAAAAEQFPVANPTTVQVYLLAILVK